MTKIELSPDCGRCAALCCVALAFDRGGLFGFDKPAGEACRHLASGGGCSIYSDRARSGFAGCVGYDCHGAGQRVTQDMFGGVSWPEDRSRLREMSAAFAVVRRAHELLMLLRQAQGLPLSPTERRRLDDLEAAIEVAGASAEAVAAQAEKTHAFLRGLRRHVVGA